MKDATLLPEKSLAWMQQPNAIDFVRYYLALVVIFTHFAVLGDRHLYFITSSWEAVCGFFTFSGFLVFYSYYKQPNLKRYFIKRAKRILPPYFFIVLLCFIAGSFISTLSWSDYWTNSATYRYLVANLSFMNFAAPTLPGVFEQNPMHAVNGALWTMKVEIILYISIPIVFYFLKRFQKITVFAGIFVFACLYHWCFQMLYDKTGIALFNVLKSHLGWQFFYFYSGAFILCYFHFFMKYAYISITLALFGYYLIDYTYLNPFFFALFLLCFSYKAKPLFFLHRKANFSYGLYLFHFPIIQLIVHYNLHQTHYYLALALVLCCSLLLAIFSYYYIERPFNK